MKTVFYLLMGIFCTSCISLMPSCTNKQMSSIYDTIHQQQIDPYRQFKPSTMVWNDTGNSTYWSRCWIHHFTYTSTGQLSSIFVKVFDSDSASSKPDSIYYTLSYDNAYSIYPTEYSFRYYGAGRGLLTNDVHKLISDQQVVYLDTAIVGIRYPGIDTLFKWQYSFSNGKMIVVRNDFKDSCVYIMNGSFIQQLNNYTLPSYDISYQYFYTYQNNAPQYVNPFWYVKVYKYMYGNGFEGLSKYLPTGISGIYPNAANYNFQTSYGYSTDTLGRVVNMRTNNSRERTSTVFTY